MGVVKSDFLCINILLILFSFNQLVNSQEWGKPFFSDAQTEGIIFDDSNGNTKLYVNEQLGPCILVIVNYSGETIPKIVDSSDFVKDFSPAVEKKDDHYIITIKQSVDFENIQADDIYRAKIVIDGIETILYVKVINLDDEPPSLQSDATEPCKITEGPDGIGNAHCTYTVTDNDGCATCTAVTLTDEDQGKIFSFVMNDDNEPDLEYPRCLTQAISSLQKKAKVHLEVNSELDYETNQNYFLDLIVQDQNGHSITVQVLVNVVDIPDVGPLWTTSVSSFSVDELTEKTFQLVAVDGDKGDIKAEICYNLTLETENVSDEEKGYFEIGEKTGMVTIHGIDRDKYQRSTYSLLVFALECEAPDWNDKLSISILVKDVNNHSPEIKICNVTAEENDDC